jgi:hypothetical protein
MLPLPQKAVYGLYAESFPFGELKLAEALRNILILYWEFPHHEKIQRQTTPYNRVNRLQWSLSALLRIFAYVIWIGKSLEMKQPWVKSPRAPNELLLDSNPQIKIKPAKIPGEIFTFLCQPQARPSVQASALTFRYYSIFLSGGQNVSPLFGPVVTPFHPPGSN